MFGRNEVTDKALLKTINQRLARTGTGGNSRVSASVRGGVVTLTGTLQFAGQRIPLMKAASHVSGVRQVVDQLTLAPRKTY